MLKSFFFPFCKPLLPTVLFLGLSTGAFATEKKSEDPKNTEIKAALEISSKKKGIAFDVKKTVESDLLGDKAQSSGKLSLKQGKMKLSLSGSDNSEIIFNGKTIWIVQRSKLKKSKVEVVTGKVNSKNKSLLVLKALESWEEFQKNFAVEDVKGEGSSAIAKLKMIGSDAAIKDITLLVDTKAHQIRNLKYTDEIGNKVSYDLEEKKDKKKVKDSEFNYLIPKDAKVTQI